MYVYKISNSVNNKVYIGQTIRPIKDRFHRHINDAMNNILDTHLARAIRKYGPEVFSIELIEECSSQEELTLREQYWIRFYNSVEDGYNETDATYKSGGNTYAKKTEEEMKAIKEKLRITKLGAKNPMARRVKRINVQTGEIDYFDTIISCAQACGIKNGKTSVNDRLNGKVKSPYKNIWTFEYDE